MALLLPIFHMNLVLKEYRRGRILWQVAGKVKVAGKERASTRGSLILRKGSQDDLLPPDISKIGRAASLALITKIYHANFVGNRMNI